MKKLLFTLVASLAILPSLTFAQVQGDINPNQTSSCVSITHNLSYRSRDISTGGDVSSLQDFLQSQSYLNSEPTGYFGLLTQSAVKQFQSANSILSSGYVGPITRAKISSLSCGATVTSSATSSNTYPVQSLTPVITSVGSPANPASSFYPGDRVTIVGYNLPANVSVYIGSTAIQAQSNSTGYNVTFYAPTTLSAGTYDLYVVGKATQSDKVSVTVLSRNNTNSNPTISYVQAPAEYQNILRSGERATVYGSNLPSGAVYIGSNSTIGQTSADGSQVTFTVPAISAGTYNLFITGKALQTNSISVTIPTAKVVPVISYVNPSSASTNNQTLVTISGSNFTSAAIVYLSNSVGSTPIQPSSVNSNSVSFYVPSGMTSGNYNLSVANGNPNGTLSNGISTAVAFSIIASTPQPSTPFTITYPTANVTLNAGQTYNATWTGADAGVDNYSVYLVGGALGNTASISLGTAYASQKSFTFTLPSTVQSGSGYQIQFSGKYVSGDNSPSFNIQGSQPASPFNITFPTSGSNLQEGQTYSVTWTGSDTGVDNYSVYLVGGSLGNTASIPLGTAYASNHSFSFTVPMSVQAGSGFQIQLSGKYASGGNSPSFTITPPPPFTITFPTSNSTLKIGQTYNLTWTGADAGVDNYSVYLVGGALGNTASVALGTAYASQKSFSWTVPSSVQPSTGYQIQFSGKYVSGDNSPSFTISQ